MSRIPPISETAFMRRVITLATLFGWDHYHTHDSRRSAAGFPDLVLIRPPRLIYAELKTKTGKLRPAQIRWLDMLRACGQVVHLWRPADWPEILELLSDGRAVDYLSANSPQAAETARTRGDPCPGRHTRN